MIAIPSSVKGRDSVSSLFSSRTQTFGVMPRRLYERVRSDCFHPTKMAHRENRRPRLCACARRNGDDAVGLDKGQWPT
ncbi:hypothetical protein WN51_00613 [Melipona quadrifasciata]|uniref:Uncharacterized protein n=1 Tax=Melipona quadrifasciata TaxID=166423 RepID=A0A0M9A251_9HYME|nr:hypothetical protein WN51_00613 [Melipona quadrifasciata]